MTRALPELRPRLLGIVAALWLALVLVIALVIVDHVRLLRWVEARPTVSEQTQVAQLEKKVVRLETSVAAIRGRPAPLSAVGYAKAEQTQNARLDEIEQTLADAVMPADLAPLGLRLTQLESEVGRLRHPQPPHLRPIPHTPERSLRVISEPADAPPPFTVLGTELRGGQQFLTVAPSGAHSLSQVRVLRPGECDGDWRLKVLEGQTAVFEIAGHLQRIPIP
ncbi:MAG: hypothetical protein ACRET5_17400 [Steroidobacteraceae bacterium]